MEQGTGAEPAGPDAGASPGHHSPDLFRRPEDHLRMLFARVPATVWTTDRSLRLTSLAGALSGRVPDGAPAPLGLTVGELVGSGDPVHPALAHHRAALAGTSGRFRSRFADRTYDVRVEPLQDEDGEILGCVGLAVDATEEVEREERLRRSEARLLESQRLARIGSWEWDVTTNRVDWSDELFRIYGLAPGEFDGSYEAFLRLVVEEDRPLTESAILTAVRTGGPLAYDHRVRRADGAVRRLHTVAERTGDGTGTRLAGSCWDVTEARAADEERELSLSLLRATLDSTADGLLVVDQRGRVTAANRRFSELWRVPERPHRGDDDQGLIEAVIDQLEDPGAFHARIQELYAQPEAESFDVLRFHDGRVFERLSRPQRLGAEVVGRVWSFRDVTDRDRLLRRAVFLADASRLLASLDAEQAVEAVARLSLPLLGTACALDLLSDQGGPRRLFVLSQHDRPATFTELPRAALAGHPVRYDDEGRSFLAVPLLARDTLLGVLRFASEPGRRHVPPELELAVELAGRISMTFDNARLYVSARDALQARDDFLSVAAHELRGRATSLQLALDGLRTGRLAGDRRQRTLDLCHRQVRQMVAFVDELLDATRLRTKRIHLELEQVDLCEAIREVAAGLSSEVSTSGSTLSLTAGGRIVGRWDRNRIEQLVRNLLSNALRFGLGRPVELVAHADAQTATLVVVDHGIGIPKDRQEAVFRPFERAVSSRHFGGLGLGLFICKSIVDALGGELRLVSTPGTGTTITVELPREGAA